MTPFGFASLCVLLLYLAAFFGASRLAARAAGRPVWLFSRATGAERWSAVGFRAAFALSFFGPLVQTAFPALHKIDPLWLETGILSGLPGHFLAIAGAMLGFAAQVAMGASWRVGVAEGAVGKLVTGGLYDLSRNPVFVGQLMLLTGVALAVPSIWTLAGAVLFWVSARNQIRSEERILSAEIGEPYRDYMSRVSRWIGLPARSGQS